MFEKIVLPNGLTLVLTPLNHFASVSIGLWVKVGTADETGFPNGISHLIEHMVFRGTDNRTTEEIALEIDRIGGELNAFTTKESTCYYSKVLKSDVDVPIRLLFDMITNSLFEEESIEKEKNVITEEIRLYEDSPEELNYELISEKIYSKTPFATPITGTEASVNRISRKEIVSYFNKFYTPDNMVLSIAGNYDSAHIIKLVTETFGTIQGHEAEERELKASVLSKGIVHRKKELEQCHIELVFPGLSYDDPDSYAAHALDNILAGTISSRLYQKLREELGLVYSITSNLSSYETTGDFSISLSLSEGNAVEAIKVIREELDRLLSDGITEDELQLAKSNLKGNFLLNTEMPENFMELYGRKILFGHRIESVDEIIEKIDELTLENIYGVMDRLSFDDVFGVSVVGNMKKDRFNKICSIMRWEESGSKNSK